MDMDELLKLAPAVTKALATKITAFRRGDLTKGQLLRAMRKVQAASDSERKSNATPPETLGRR